MRRANSGDIPLLLDLMADFYAEGGYALDRSHAAAGILRRAGG